MEKITVRATVHTTILNAWNYYTRPEHIMRWNFAADNWHCPHVINDVKVGGEFIARMEAKDNGTGMYL